MLLQAGALKGLYGCFDGVIDIEFRNVKHDAVFPEFIQF